jgi:uncharacterized radical SAM superfamily Fe-S cluster-containing enzyme
MSEYMIMTAEEAIAWIRSSKSEHILISTVNLEEKNIPEIMKKIKKIEGEKLVLSAKTITAIRDEFVNQLNLYSEIQSDIFNIKPKGLRKIILINRGD